MFIFVLRFYDSYQTVAVYHVTICDIWKRDPVIQKSGHYVIFHLSFGICGSVGMVCVLTSCWNVDMPICNNVWIILLLQVSTVDQNHAVD